MKTLVLFPKQQIIGQLDKKPGNFTFHECTQWFVKERQPKYIITFESEEPGLIWKCPGFQGKDETYDIFFTCDHEKIIKYDEGSTDYEAIAANDMRYLFPAGHNLFELSDFDTIEDNGLDHGDFFYWKKAYINPDEPNLILLEYADMGYYNTTLVVFEGYDDSYFMIKKTRDIFSFLEGIDDDNFETYANKFRTLTKHELEKGI